MGVISRKIFPSCGNFCVCCPALRPSSRRPVKRYKKLLAEIFPKTQEGPVNERKIMKLCEYAAKNPLRIPKIAKFLEQRSHKELRFEHVNFIKIITEAYGKLLYICKEQMAYFAISLVTVVNELLGCKHQDIQVLGCQTLTRFIYSQTDNTYARNIESLVRKVCTLSHEHGEKQSLIRAASLQCLSSMIWFMTEYSYMFSDFDEIVNSILENYRKNETSNGEEERNTTQHNWVDEIVRSEGRASAIVTADVSPRNTPLAQPDREQHESPDVWAHICVQKLAELAKESSTMRRVLEPMFVYFDINKQWAPRHGLALLVLSDLSLLRKSSGNEQMILTAGTRHLDHKNVASDPQMKSDLVQTLTSLAHQLRSRGITAELAVVSDLCKHLRKCLEALAQAQSNISGIEIEAFNLNESLQNSIADCLLDIVKGMKDSRPIFDMMAITLEKLPTFNAVSRAILGSLLILSHVISLTCLSSQNLTVFPESLLLQILKCMTHPDQETRLGAHLLFSSILVRAPHHQRGDSEYLYETKKWQSRTTSVFASATALLEKLRRDKESLSGDNIKKGNCSKDRSFGYIESKSMKNCSVFFTKLGFSVFDRIAVSASANDMENNIIMLTEDQTAQVLSAIWIQANMADNLPFNYEAIAHSFSLTLLASRLKNSSNGNTVRLFQLPLSLRNVALSPNENLPPACQRSIFTMTMSMLAFCGKIYNITELTDSMKCFSSPNIDPYLRIGEDLQLYVRHQSDLNSFGSEADHNTARSILNDLRGAIIPKSQVIDIIVNALSSSTKETCSLEKDDLSGALNENFVPDDVPLFGSSVVLDWAFSEESLSLDEECSRSSSVDGGIANVSPAVSFPSFISTVPAQPPHPHVISVGQLLESALHVAGQVAGTSVSTSPLPYGTMANQCEALGMGSRKKLSSWLVNGGYDSSEDASIPDLYPASHIAMKKLNSYLSAELDMPIPSEPWRALRLPPASPFDNFLKAAGC
ncbi:hypothetical protein LUZ60_010525 [Juncus effusus]|nr:hypothetical protein LUZ60_010525 [Juncus effusus]